MTIGSLIEELHEREESIRRTRNAVLTSIALVQIEEDNLGRITTNHITDKVLICTKDYSNHLRALRLLRKETGETMPIGMHWYSCGTMLFKWESDQFEVRYECPPDDIPAELMPSASCTVKEEVRTERTYAIVCQTGE